VADKYWTARGGSASDGGAFMFTVKDTGKGDGSKQLICTDKFGRIVSTPKGQKHYRPEEGEIVSEPSAEISILLGEGLAAEEDQALKRQCLERLPDWSYASLVAFCEGLIPRAAGNDAVKTKAIEVY
jgi:hypothetical protein